MQFVTSKPFSYKQAGFTFHELLVAMSITSVAVLGYAATTTGLLRGGQSSAHYTAAANLAHDKLEQLKSVALSPVDNCAAPAELGLTPTASPGGIFDRCWRVTDSPLGANLKQIEVRVNWRDFEPHQFTIVSLMYVGP